MTSEVKIKAFRATDDPAKRDAYHSGLELVLSYYGITRVTSQSRDWFENPETWIIIVETMDGSTVLGGSRMQLSANGFPLPIEKAIAFKDPRIYAVVDRYAPTGVGELCGMWNSRKVAGMGLGSVFLGIASIAIASRIGMNTVLSLCAPSTRAMAGRLGFVLNEELGNKGEFIYPKENLVATAMVLEDPDKVSHAAEFEQNRILKLRENPIQTMNEITQKGNLTIHYEL